MTVLNSQAVAGVLHFQGDPLNTFSLANMLREKTSTMVYPLSDQSMRWRLFLAQAKKHWSWELGVGGGWWVGSKLTKMARLEYLVQNDP